MAWKHEAGAPEKYIVAIFAFAEILHCYFIDVLAYRQTRLTKTWRANCCGRQVALMALPPNILSQISSSHSFHIS